MGYYVKINETQYLKDGDIVIESAPIDFWDIVDLEDKEETDNKDSYYFFGMHYVKEFCDLIEAIGGKRGEFISYLIKKKNGQNQISNQRVKDLAADAGVSLQTANDALEILRNNDLAKTAPMNIMINPRLERKGNRRREVLLSKLYSGFYERRKKFSCSKEKTLDN